MIPPSLHLDVSYLETDIVLIFSNIQHMSFIMREKVLGDESFKCHTLFIQTSSLKTFLWAIRYTIAKTAQHRKCQDFYFQVHSKYNIQITEYLHKVYSNTGAADEKWRTTRMNIFWVIFLAGILPLLVALKQSSNYILLVINGYIHQYLKIFSTYHFIQKV